MKNNLTKYHQLLNQEGSYPETYLRRNHIMYPLVCYINNIICLYVSDNYEPIPLFIRRANEHLIRFADYEGERDTKLLTRKYKNIASEYLSEMAKFMLSQDIDLIKKRLIPKELYE